MRRVYEFRFGSVRFDLPETWGDACDENVISFSSPSRHAALTITVHDSPRLAPADIERISANRKPFGIPLSEMRVLSIPGGTGYAREFEKREERRSYWLAHFLFLESSTIIASMNGSFEDMRDHREEYEKILSSIAWVADFK